MHFRLGANNVLSPLSGLLLCSYKLGTKARFGHDFTVTLFFVLRCATWYYTMTVYINKIIGKVAANLAVLDNASVQWRYKVALLAARWFWVPFVFSAVRSAPCVCFVAVSDPYGSRNNCLDHLVVGVLRRK